MLKCTGSHVERYRGLPTFAPLPSTCPFAPPVGETQVEVLPGTWWNFSPPAIEMTGSPKRTGLAKLPLFSDTVAGFGGRVHGSKTANFRESPWIWWDFSARPLCPKPYMDHRPQNIRG